LYRQSGAEHAWYTAPSGTAGNAITFTQAMTLDASGRLGTGGVTSPTYQVDIGNSSAGGNMLRMTASTTEMGGFISGGTPFFGAISNHAFVLITNSTERARLDTSGNLGIGTSSPAYKLDVNGNAQVGNATAATNRFLYVNGVVSKASAIGFQESGVNRWLIGNGAASENGNFEIYDATNGNNLVMTRTGNLGLGVTPSAWGSIFRAVQVGTGGSIFGRSSGNQDVFQMGANVFWDGSNWKYIGNGASTRYEQATGTHVWSYAASGTAGNTITFTEAMTLDASGNLGVGLTGPATRIHARVTADSDSQIAQFENLNTAGTDSHRLEVFADAANNFVSFKSTGSSAGGYKFITGNDERLRLTQPGDLLVGTTSAVQFNTTTVTGWNVNNVGQSAQAASSGTVAFFNRLTDDGTIVSLRQAGTEEGTISVSGNTVSYNAFAGSHWSQLQDGSKPDILRGTVMESINELCVWPDENNERLPKAKISDTAGSKKVYGVFMAWDNDWTTTNDMYVTAVGAFICRVNGSVTVQEGDLLESNGDGTARVQADDIIRSSTIGKVTSTVKTHQYADGSYCVPTVLYCG
jgi:hypothetical protein